MSNAWVPNQFASLKTGVRYYFVFLPPSEHTRPWVPYVVRRVDVNANGPGTVGIVHGDGSYFDPYYVWLTDKMENAVMMRDLCRGFFRSVSRVLKKGGKTSRFDLPKPHTIGWVKKGKSGTYSYSPNMKPHRG